MVTVSPSLSRPIVTLLWLARVYIQLMRPTATDLRRRLLLSNLIHLVRGLLTEYPFMMLLLFIHVRAEVSHAHILIKIAIVICDLVQIFQLIVRLIGHFIDLLCQHRLEESIGLFGWLKLFMDDFKRVGNSIVFAFECSETGQDLVIDAFDKDYSVERIEFLLLQILVPLLNLLWDLNLHIMAQLLLDLVYLCHTELWLIMPRNTRCVV